MSICVKINGLRAVRSAEIPIDGISVLSGVNGSGKSTISKFTYEFLTCVLGFNDLVDREMSVNLGKLHRALFAALTNLNGIIPMSVMQRIRREFFFAQDPFRPVRAESLERTFETIAGALSQSMDNFSKKDSVRINAFFSTLSSSLKQEISTPEEMRVSMAMRIAEIQEKAQTDKVNRKLSVFQNFWKAEFLEQLNPSEFNIEEENVPIFDFEKNSLRLTDAFDKVFYVDTPMLLGEFDSRKNHWRNLNYAVQGKNQKPSFTYGSVEQDGLLSGSSEWKSDDVSEGFFYTRKDGAKYNLLECATGLKSFSIIQMLYREGKIDEKTLLILDEPESHLHPQWIAEYAKLVVSLHKMLGVKFLIASHSPDMIRALKYISEYEFKAEADRLVKFYLAEPKDAYSFEFVPQGLDISKIFQAFNVSLDRIDEYSEDADVSESGPENA